jgi:transcriptional regulator with XRE-family HTH domain
MIKENLRLAFDSAGLIVKEVSKLSGVNKYTLDNWLNKNKEPQANALYLVCKSINITMEQAVDGERGAEYVRQWARKQGGLWEPPEHIADIVTDLLVLDDSQLDMIRASAHIAAESKRGPKVNDLVG